MTCGSIVATPVPPWSPPTSTATVSVTLDEKASISSPIIQLQLRIFPERNVALKWQVMAMNADGDNLVWITEFGYITGKRGWVTEARLAVHLAYQVYRDRLPL